MTISKRTGAEITQDLQYVKDFSFENPKAPEIYTLKNLKPHLEVTVDINATRLRQETYEVEIVLGMTAKNENTTIYVLELNYAGIFHINNVENNLVQENLFVDCPILLFPFARRIVFEFIRDAGFQPVLLDVVDFEALYNSRKNTLQND
jgi:preprotein translocase subunit SecB